MTAPGLTTPVVIRGRLLDGAGSGIGDGVLEFWAAGFDGLGRVWTSADGSYGCTPRSRPTRVEPGGAVHAPHFAVRVLARGILTEYLTRVYFADEPDNARDAVLQLGARRLAARRSSPCRRAATEYHLDIVVQGEGETVFFDV